MSHSTDFRERVLAFIAEGGLIKDVCKIFVVSRSSVQRWRKKQEEPGDLNAKTRSCAPYKFTNQDLRSYVAAHPDAYLNEIATHFSVTTACISIALKRLKITRKKRLPST
ncbi:MAG: transposase [Gammaproteobacteria bacterium]|nr:transposase [Gammaproteobacteria bacterium]MCH9762987.1 transposase [Gammaproteobacteria bacterium]